MNAMLIIQPNSWDWLFLSTVRGQSFAWILRDTLSFSHLFLQFINTKFKKSQKKGSTIWINQTNLHNHLFTSLRYKATWVRHISLISISGVVMYGRESIINPRFAQFSTCVTYRFDEDYLHYWWYLRCCYIGQIMCHYKNINEIIEQRIHRHQTIITAIITVVVLSHRPVQSDSEWEHSSLRHLQMWRPTLACCSWCTSWGREVLFHWTM